MGNRFLIIFLGIFGSLFLCTGLGLQFFVTTNLKPTRLAQANLAIIKSLQQFQEVSPGQSVIVEGIISRKNPLLIGQLVAYNKYEYRPPISSNEYQWEKTSKVHPSLQIEINDGAVTCDQYNMSFTGVAVRQENQLYRGLTRFQPVVCSGKFQPQGDSLIITLGGLNEGNGHEYQKNLRDRGLLDYFAFPFIAVGLVTLGITGFIAWKNHQPPKLS